ncbi:MAG: glycosyl transferase [Oscillibacter sp.]|nr:glycosyl transferase [Oscillibacter sp.]
MRGFGSIKTKLAALVYYNLSPISPGLTTRLLYRRKFKRPLDLNAPKTLNEKILWLKLNTYRDDPLVTRCADKWLVREYVSSAGWGEVLNEVCGVWASPREIPWEELPESFVLKCNHGCGYNILCPQKSGLDIPRSVRQLERWMGTDFWRCYAELQYRGIPKRILCEKYLGDGEHIPVDYKVYCFHGEPRYILVCDGREKGWPRFYFFDRDWNFCPITRDGLAAPLGFTLQRPPHLDGMLSCAAALSAPFPFVRVDFYEAEGRLIFGELTFTPSGGLDTGRLPETDLLFGSLLELPPMPEEDMR